MGRVSAQKDPAFFCRTLDHIRASDPSARGLWVGDGPPDRVAGLRGAGVEVTGWLGHSQALRALARGDVYVHTAAWEGFPLAVLEAHHASVPIVCREIPAFRGAPQTSLASTPEAVSALVLDICTDADLRTQNLTAWQAFLSANNPQAQRSALMSIYAARPA
jgi:glycosyltransferase involved in cell wall biosynthesis